MYLRTATLLAFLIGCSARGSETPGTPDGGTGGVAEDGGTIDPNGLPPVVESSKSRLQFKGGPLYASLLSTGLGIPREELCTELGLYDCISDVHRISLLDVEPYRTGILEPLENTGISTPIAVERVALSACTRWARRGVGTDRRAIATALYQNLLQREPEEREVEHLEELYASMAAAGDPALDQSWAALSCFAVATTMEALFY